MAAGELKVGNGEVWSDVDGCWSDEDTGNLVEGKSTIDF